MAGVETALLRAAGSVVSLAGKWWLGKRRDRRERGAPLIELIGAGIADDLGVRKAGRRLDDIMDVVFERLQPLVRRRDGGLPEGEIVAALDAVARTLDTADLSDAALFADDVDPVLVAARLRRELPGVPERAGLGEAAVLLYARVLDESCVCLTQLVVQLGPFQARASVQVLERLTVVAESLAQVLARVPVTSLDAPAGDRHDDEFRGRYLRQVLDKLDLLELFGVNVHRYRLRTPLSIAYISLAVSGAAVRRRGMRWDPGRFRRDGADGSASVRAEQALGSADRILLRGDAGSGKTTLLQWIAVTAARQGFTGDLESWNGRTPFLVRLRDHVKQGLPAPERFLDKLAAVVAAQMPALWVHRRLAAGAILLVDGVDEVPEGQRREVREWLRGLLREYPDLRVVVTSRPAAASARWLDVEGFTSIVLERMSPADVKALIRHWHEAVRRAGDLPCEPHRLPGYEQRLLAQLDGSAHLQNLAGSPLLCAMLCALNLDRDSNLPRNRMDIYQAAIDMLLHERDDKRGVHNELRELTSGDQAQLLQEVAWWLTENGRAELSREEAEARVERRLAGIRHITDSAGPVLDHMIQRSGVLREPVVGRVDFVHRTFQEYLAAREAADQGRAGALVAHAHLDTWRETIVLAAGHANAVVRRELLTGLLDLAEQQPQHARKLRLLAAACLETSPAVDPGVLSQIRAHLRGLMPRSLAEAPSLAAVGESILAELPADLSTLSEARAAAVVRTVALANGPAALTVLARYATDPRPRVQRQLIAGWDYFDPLDYAERVLADAPLDNGSVKVGNVSLLPGLSRLRHLSSTGVEVTQSIDVSLLAGVPFLHEVSLDGGLTGELGDLAGHTGLHSLTADVRGRHQDLSWLRGLPELTMLFLWGTHPDQDLTILAQLPNLKKLALHGHVDIMRILAGLPGLELFSGAMPAGWDPSTLNALVDLKALVLVAVGEPRGGVTALVSHLHRPELLYLGRCGWLTDLTALAGLVTLTKLSIEEVSATDLGPLAGLPLVRSLTIGNGGHHLDLTPLAGLTPLRDLKITKSPAGLDLAPLSGGKVTVHLPRGLPVRGAEGVRVKRF
ncbi:NACHT domain-containing protein [Actinoplanes sp. NPDC051494]|uniref:NACHT domain-containing protein n=1 Tax=Actinoplanes sp. NPDC051494 TaxID=3363907 RepID=UPI0037A94BE9